MNARRNPSGDQRGVFSAFSPVMSALAAPPPAGAVQMSAFRLPTAKSVVVRT